MKKTPSGPSSFFYVLANENIVLRTGRGGPGGAGRSAGERQRRRQQWRPSGPYRANGGIVRRARGKGFGQAGLTINPSLHPSIHPSITCSPSDPRPFDARDRRRRVWPKPRCSAPPSSTAPCTPARICERRWCQWTIGRVSPRTTRRGTLHPAFTHPGSWRRVPSPPALGSSRRGMRSAARVGPPLAARWRRG